MVKHFFKILQPDISSQCSISRAHSVHLRAPSHAETFGELRSTYSQYIIACVPYHLWIFVPPCRILQLRELFEAGLDVKFTEEHNPHDVGALLKEFFRDMPESLLTKDLYQAFIATRSECTAPIRTANIDLQYATRDCSAMRSYWQTHPPSCCTSGLVSLTVSLEPLFRKRPVLLLCRWRNWV